ncbi:MAG: argininosuccinate lyase, partial [Bifidobacterium sp.]
QVDTLEVVLPAFSGMVATLRFDGKRLEEEAPTGFALATDIAEWLVKNGVPFRHAHELSGACVKRAEGQGEELWDLTDDEFVEIFDGFVDAGLAPKVREVLTTQGSVKARNGKGGTAPERVAEQIEDAEAQMKTLSQWVSVQ